MEIQSDQLVMATFNVRTDIAEDGPENGPFRWSTRLPYVKKLFLDYQWDIVGLQEVRENQLEDLKGMADYDCVGEKRWLDAFGEYNPICYKRDKVTLLSTETFWLSETPGVASKADYWGAENPRICTVAHFEVKHSKKEIVVVNTHFDHIGEEARYQSALLILGKVRAWLHDRPVVLLGDFNGDEGERWYKTVSKELNDAVAASPHHVGPLVTCTGVAFSYRPSWDNMHQIDYLFVNDRVEVVKTTTVTDHFKGYYASDHFPVSLLCRLK